MFAQQLREDLLARFAIFLNPSSPGFDSLPAAACLLDPTVSTILTDREDVWSACCIQGIHYSKGIKSSLQETS